MFDIRNHGGNFSGSTPNNLLNIFFKTTQPPGYNGIWFNTENTLKEIVKTTAKPLFAQEKYIYSTVPFASQWSASAVVGDKIYVFGSHAGGTANTNASYVYDTKTDSWTKLTDVPFANAMCAEVYGDDIFVFGSSSTAAASYFMYKYSITNNSWTQMANSSYNLARTGSVIIGQFIYTYGYLLPGGSAGAVLQKYDVINNTWTALQSFNGTANAMMVAYNGDFYTIGGDSSTTIQNNVCKYTVSTNSWSVLAANPFTMTGGSCVVKDGVIYMIGVNNTNYNKNIYRYDIATNSWLTSITGAFNSSHYFNTAEIINNTTIYAIGGPSAQTITSAYALEDQIYYPNTILVFDKTSTNKTKILNNSFAKDIIYLTFDKIYYCNSSGFIDKTMAIKYGNGSMWNALNY